jgi:hypothetical protein
MGAREVPFPTVEHLERYWRNNPREPVKACLVEMFAYPSFFQEVLLFKGSGDAVRMRVEFFSQKLLDADLTKMAYVVYEIPSLAAALAWIRRKFLHSVADFRLHTDRNPGDDEDDARPQHRRYEAAWKRLQADFRKGKLLDKKFRVVARFAGR